MDVAFTQNPQTGRLTFARNAAGDFYLDDRGTYAVLATLYAQKGRYFWDATVGTYLSTIKQDVRATGTRLIAAASDALEQVRQEGMIRGGSATAERLRLGAWSLPIRWLSPRGEEQRGRG